MTLGHFSPRLKSFLLVTLAMLLWISVFSCADDLTAPRVFDDQDEQDEAGSGGEDEEGKGAMSLNQIIENQIIDFSIQSV